MYKKVDKAARLKKIAVLEIENNEMYLKIGDIRASISKDGTYDLPHCIKQGGLIDIYKEEILCNLKKIARLKNKIEKERVK